MRIRSSLLRLLVLALGLPAVAHAYVWPWPLNGKVINHYHAEVIVWADDKGGYRIPAGATSPDSDDVDHIKEPATGRWCKISLLTVTVNEDGRLNRCSCWVSRYGVPCGK